MVTVIFVLASIIVLIVVTSIRSVQIQNGRLKQLKIILNKINQLLSSDASSIYLDDITYNDARAVMEWFFQIQNLHLYHPDIYKKPNTSGEIGELIEEFQSKENPYRPIKNSESFLLRISDVDYLIILSENQTPSVSSPTVLEVERVTHNTPLRGTFPSDCYTPDWSNISRQYREKQCYKCQECGVDLSSEQYLLHTHHKNRDKGDNREINLIALCAYCHKKQPYHEQRLLVPDIDLQKIALLREQQRVKRQEKSRE